MNVKTFEEFMYDAYFLDEASPRPTVLPKSRERDIGKHDDWKDKPSTEWGERPEAGKKLRRRLIAVVGTQRRQDKETGVSESTEDSLNEILALTPLPKRKKPQESAKSKKDPYGEDPEITAEKLKKKQQEYQESSDYLTRERAKEAYQKYLDRKKSKSQTPPNQSPLRPGEVRTFNKQTNRWESNKN